MKKLLYGFSDLTNWSIKGLLLRDLRGQHNIFSGGSRGGAWGSAPPPLFLDQTEARMVYKQKRRRLRPEEPRKFFLSPPPPSLTQGLDDRPPLIWGSESTTDFCSGKSGGFWLDRRGHHRYSGMPHGDTAWCSNKAFNMDSASIPESCHLPSENKNISVILTVKHSESSISSRSIRP